MRRAFFTSASYAYLDRARILFGTIREFHPDWEIWLCLVDDAPDGVNVDFDSEAVDFVVNARDLPIVDFQSWSFSHNVVELCTAVKGTMLCTMLDDGIDRVVYLDPDIALFGPLTEAVELLDTRCGVITPHLVQPETTPEGIRDNEIGALKHGIYNLGFLAVNSSAEGRRLAEWWRDRLVAYCFEDVPNGIFTDQKWFDHVPVFFPTVATLLHPGYNVASWNLSQRPIAIRRDGAITAGGEPLRFFHFTKLGTAGIKMIERYAGATADVFEIVCWYNALLAKSRLAGLPDRWWSYSRYDNGSLITPADRLAHRAARNLNKDLRNPFASQVPIAELTR